MRKIFKQINYLLSSSEKKLAVQVLVLTIIAAFLEIVGIASIMPFMAVLATPDIVETNRHLNWAYNAFNFYSTNDFLFFLGLLVLLALIVSNSIKAYTHWKTLDFGTMTGHTISTRLFSNYLCQPYPFFLNKNSAYLSKTVLNEVHALVNNVLIPLTNIISRALMVAAILMFLLAVDPVLAISTGLILGAAFGLVYLALRSWLLRIGAQRVDAQTKRYKIVGEGLAGIKNIKLTGHEKTYADLYTKPSYKYSKATALSQAAGEIPKYALEVIGFGGILFIVLYLLLQRDGLSQILPLISLYAFAGYRLLPNFQVIFRGYTKIRFHTALLQEIYDEVTTSGQNTLVLKGPEAPMAFLNTIEFKGVCFGYNQNEKQVLKDLNFTVKKGSRFALSGKTGSGKTTIVDLMLGLLSPVSGKILIDGAALNSDNICAWQQNCAYVTQHIYLTDDTLRANIAFGLPKEDIDDEKVRSAAEMASLSDFVEKELPQKYDTMIGENGVRLSGGQRQRIGLARALYLDRPVLVLDEATSALDKDTEQEIMSVIDNLGPDRTVIIITHRTDTIKDDVQVLKL